MQEIVSHLAKSFIDNIFDLIRSSLNEKKEKKLKLIEDIESLHKHYLDFYDRLTSLLMKNHSDELSKEEASYLLESLNLDSSYKIDKARLLAHATQILNPYSQKSSDDSSLTQALIRYLTVDVADGNVGKDITQMASPITGIRQYLLFGTIPQSSMEAIYQSSVEGGNISDKPIQRKQLLEIIERLRDIQNSHYFQIINQLNQY